MTIDLRFHRGLSQGQQLRRLLTEFVRVVERERLATIPGLVTVEVVPCVSVQGAFGVATEWDGGEQTILLAGRDFQKPRNRKEAEESQHLVRVLQVQKKLVPWHRHVCWTLGHELAHICGEMDEEKADAWGLLLLESARAKSAVLRSGTRKQ